MIKLSYISEDLRKWFGKGPTGGWDRYNSKGEKVGKCGDSEEGSAYAACLSNEKAAKLGKDGRAAFVKRKRAAQKDAGDAEKGGEKKKGQKPTFVKTGASEGISEDWSQKYKDSIDCNNPKGFSQRAHCQGKKKNETMNIEEKLNLFLEKNCPTDPAKWSASKAAAKKKFDVYPSAYANGWAAKNYKGKGGGWKTCNEGEANALCEETYPSIEEIPSNFTTAIVLSKEEFMNEATASEVIKDLDKVKNDLLKKVEILVAKKKKLYSNVDIESPMSADEKKLDKEIADLFSQIQQLIRQKRSIKEGILDEACWDGYKQVGMKDKGGRQVPNCVPESVEEGFEHIKTGEKTFNRSVIEKIKNVFPNLKRIETKSVPQIGKVLYIKDGNGNNLGHAYIDKKNGVTISQNK